ncbi:Beta-lactamase domain protein [Candidatus Sulfopaludibacter sp. SbA3]|nr:Beta-lactamase domain protein [Candidatus Sulfopaludibacter sp. SbA3]
MSSAITLGDFEVSLIRDSVYWWDGGVLFGVVPKTLWSRKTPADELNRIPLAFNCYLIRTGSHTILLETGLGDKRDAKARERMRVPAVTDPLPGVIARHGVDPEAIDIVINSHLHWDHCCGNTTMQDGRALPTFPRARYFASRGEWEHAHERLVRDRVAYLDENYDPLVESGQMTLVEGDHEVVPGVWMRRAPGHNRDMMVITAESQGQTFCFLSDLVPTAPHLQPSWVTGLDLYPLDTIENKILWLTRAAEGDWQCGFGHDTEIDFARIARDAKAGFIVRAV